MRKRPRPLHRFVVRPVPSSRVEVVVFRTVREVQDACQSAWRTRLKPLPRKNVRGLIAYTATYSDRPDLHASIVLSDERCGISTLTHEAFHATMRWANRRGWPALPIANEVTNIEHRGAMSHEEELAEYHGELVRKIVNRFNDLKVYR